MIQVSSISELFHFLISIYNRYSLLLMYLKLSLECYSRIYFHGSIKIHKQRNKNLTNLKTRVDISVMFFCVIFSIGFAQLNVVKRKFITAKDRRIIPTSTTVIQQMTPSTAVCASLCSIKEMCCSASYDTKTIQCNLDESGCPESEISADALMLTKEKLKSTSFFFSISIN